MATSELQDQWEPGRLIERARNEKGLSANEAARRAGITPRWWRHVEVGHYSAQGTSMKANPRSETLVKMAVVVGLEPRNILLLAGFDEHVTVAEESDLPIESVQISQLTPESRRLVLDLVNALTDAQRPSNGSSAGTDRS